METVDVVAATGGAAVLRAVHILVDPALGGVAVAVLLGAAKPGRASIVTGMRHSLATPRSELLQELCGGLLEHSGFAGRRSARHPLRSAYEHRLARSRSQCSAELRPASTPSGRPASYRRHSCNAVQSSWNSSFTASGWTCASRITRSNSRARSILSGVIRSIAARHSATHRIWSSNLRRIH